ncbi:MAG: tetratricopeptide repeat protein [Pseudanabaena sp. RU_4_16]|nr:tetratricopeptide repeat protein [Pseudanabaena sp. RU_4_16]
MAKLIGSLYAQNAQRTLANFPKPLPRSSSGNRTSTNPDTQPNQLRIGFISVNFRRHPVGWCSADTIGALAKLTPHIYLYATSKFKQDDRTQVFEAIACKCNWQEECWQQQKESETFNNLSDLIAEIEQDDLDVLIDLDSLTASRHPEILIRKPARLCVSWLGFDAPYLCSDNYNLGDRHTHPPGIEDYYIERTLRLPDSHMAVADFPSVKIDGKVQRKLLKLRIKDIIYLCVTPSIKLNRDTVEAHIQIIKSVPNSLLLYKGRGDLDIVKSLYHEACTAQGIDRKRVKFLTLTSTEEEHRSIYAAADVMLDSYPYNGGSHTLEALWFDLPVVTRLGEQSFARMGYSFLITLGIIDGIAQSWDEYIQWGIRLGNDKALRDSIRQRLIKSKQPEHLSPLWNPAKLAEDMYNLFAEILEGQREHDPDSEFELGNRFWQAGNMAEAARHYRQAIALQSDRAETWGNLGTVLHGEGKLDEAIEHYQKSLQLNPVNFTIQLNLGKALQAKGNNRAAGECYKKAIDIDPDQITPHNRLGDIFFAQYNLDEAFACFQRAIEIDPTYAFSHGRLGVIHLEWHQVDLAIACFRRSILHNPEYANAHINLSLALLLKGEYQEGFLEYEWRWRSTDILNSIPNYLQPVSQPLWDGSNFSGQTLLVYAEQGLGDTIQFIRYIPLVKELGGEDGRILFDCPESLAALLSQISGISLVDSKQIPATLRSVCSSDELTTHLRN